MTITDYFEIIRTRDDNNKHPVYALNDDAPEWLRDAVRDAHHDELPDDWRYETCVRILDAIGEIGPDLVESWEIAESLVDVYNHDLAHWLAANISRGQYIDQWHEEFDENFQSIWHSISSGQLLCIQSMADTLIEAVRANKEDE